MNPCTPRHRLDALPPREHLLVRKSQISARAPRGPEQPRTPQSTGFNRIEKAQAFRESLIARSMGDALNGARDERYVGLGGARNETNRGRVDLGRGQARETVWVARLRPPENRFASSACDSNRPG